jgi:hypothetical protein
VRSTRVLLLSVIAQEAFSNHHLLLLFGFGESERPRRLHATEEQVAAM